MDGGLDMAEAAYERAGSMERARIAEIEAWASQRPAPRARTGSQIQPTITAITVLSRCGDVRVQALGKGACWAAVWISGQSPIAPATRRDLPQPSFTEVGQEIEAAGRAAAGVDRLPHADWCDEARIAARGVEEWLAWVFVPAYPMPVWLMPGTPLDEVRWVLGDVGVDDPGGPGLLGTPPGPGRFAYDVADYIDGL